MSIVAWILFGLVAGFVASRFMNNTGADLSRDIVLGIAGAITGGFLFHRLGNSDITGFNLASLFVAVCGASVILFLFHALAGRSGVDSRTRVLVPKSVSHPRSRR
jgi:uncharacterized membrane protein YeaQ/YmgE (transglycosylase-associated protein family)